MPFHHSPSTGELWCGRVLSSSRHFYSHQLSVGFYLLFPLFYYHYWDSRVTQQPRTRTRPRPFFLCKDASDFRLSRKEHACLFIHLFGRSCTLAFRCVSLSIQQSGPPDLGYSSAPRLLTTIKLTGADVTVLHFHTVQCLRRGHVEG